MAMGTINYPAHGGTAAPPSFPHEIFPARIKTFYEQTTAAINCPGDYVGCGILACASIAIGNTSVVEIKKGWQEGANLYLAIIGEPGSKKTPALILSLNPIFEIQKIHKENFEKGGSDGDNGI
jgi:hypothetical protein